MRPVGSRSQDKCGDENINASAMNRNPVLQPGACEGLELTIRVVARHTIDMWQGLFVYTIHNLSWKHSASCAQFYGPFPTHEYVLKLSTPRFGDKTNLRLQAGFPPMLSHPILLLERTHGMRGHWIKLTILPHLVCGLELLVLCLHVSRFPQWRFV
jgi:hypothetical protein